MKSDFKNEWTDLDFVFESFAFCLTSDVSMTAVKNTMQEWMAFIFVSFFQAHWVVSIGVL